ncbi:hypothetical protein [Oceanibacterium hippocampi]|uniref:Uncharacterized protein n=1 Tax=Oceanibacterium hippocampi TaxID=745714 RepID=A0A1Y5TZH7_9PROT|nr:hypothetical protein [Oceanibacterium hippocampi]SLN77384.1 hypothetical protein OCH7691_04397 [Oceanibacterium hippocampi]
MDDKSKIAQVVARLDEYNLSKTRKKVFDFSRDAAITASTMLDETSERSGAGPRNRHLGTRPDRAEYLAEAQRLADEYFLRHPERGAKAAAEWLVNTNQLANFKTKFEPGHLRKFLTKKVGS